MTVADERVEGADHGWPGDSELLAVECGQALEQCLGFGCQAEQDLALVVSASLAHEKRSAFELVDERDGGVMLHAEAFRDRANRWSSAVR